MKKYIFSTLASLLSLGQMQAAEPNFAEITMKQNPVTGRYEVFAKFDVDGPISLGMSMISIVLPAEAEDAMLSCQSSNGGLWVDLSRTHNENGFDYHGLISNGQSNIVCKANTEIKLFDFAVAGKPIKNVALWDIGKHIKETKDGTDYRSNFYVPKSAYYIIPQVYETKSTATGELETVDSLLKVFPNPTTDEINVQLSDNYNLTQGAIFSILNMEGKLVQEQTLQTNEQLIKVNINKLPAATYWIKIDNNIQVLHYQIVKLQK
jgi:hypothetical protein